MTGYERLKGLVENDHRFMPAVEGAFWNILYNGGNPYRVLSHMADTICGLMGLSAEVHGNSVVFYMLTSRAKHPACILVSMNAGQPSSPSAMFIMRGTRALVQVFEGDADDTQDIMAGTRPLPAHWVETKGRVLLH